MAQRGAPTRQPTPPTGRGAFSTPGFIPDQPDIADMSKVQSSSGFIPDDVEKLQKPTILLLDYLLNHGPDMPTQITPAAVRDDSLMGTGGPLTGAYGAPATPTYPQPTIGSFFREFALGATEMVGGLSNDNPGITSLPEWMRPAASFIDNTGRMVSAFEANPIAAAYDAVKGTLQAGVNAVNRGGKAIRDGDPDALANSLGSGYAVGRPTAAAASAHPPVVDSAPRAIINRITRKTEKPGTYGLPKVLEEAPASLHRPKPTEAQRNPTVSVIKSGVKGEHNPYETADIIIPIAQQAAAELGLSTDTLAAKVPYRNRNIIDRDSGAVAVRSGGEVLTGGKSMIGGRGILEQMVDIADRPFKGALDKVGHLSADQLGMTGTKTRQVKTNTLNDIEALARKHDRLRPDLAAAIRARAETLQRAETLNDFHDVKIDLNKESAPQFDATTGQIINSSINPSTSARLVGGIVKSHLYPELQRLTGIDLSKAGPIESAVLDARDGAAQAYLSTLKANADKLSAPGMKEATGGSSGASHEPGRIARILNLTEASPAGKFNRQLQRAVGEVPPIPDRVPYYPPGRALGDPVRDLSGVQSDLLPSDYIQAPPGQYSRAQGSLLEPPPGMAEMSGPLFQVQQRAGTQRLPQLLLNPAPGPQPGFFKITGEPTIQTLSQIEVVGGPSRGLSPTRSPEPRHELNFGGGKGEGSAQTPNWQWIAEDQYGRGVVSDTTPLRSPAGPGVMTTNDPKVAQSTVANIDARLKADPPPALARQLSQLRADLVRQLQEYYRAQPKP